MALLEMLLLYLVFGKLKYYKEITMKRILLWIGLFLFLSVNCWAGGPPAIPPSTSIGESATYENLNTNGDVDTDLTNGATASTIPSSAATVEYADTKETADTAIEKTDENEVITGTREFQAGVKVDGNDIAAPAKAPVQTNADTAADHLIAHADMNQAHLVTDTDTADYDIADGECNAAADVGNWVVIIKKFDFGANTLSITSNDASNYFVLADNTDTAADHELDMPEGCHQICLVCMAAEYWYVTGHKGIAPTDGGAAD